MLHSIFNNFIGKLYRWQDLAGALIGASVPIMVLIITTWLQRRSEQKNSLISLEKSLVLSINNIHSSYGTINNFITIKIPILINNVNNQTAMGKYSVDQAFFPLFSVHKLSPTIVEGKFGSNYINNKAIQVHNILADLSSVVEDLHGQFTGTVEFNQKMAFEKFNSAAVQNKMYITNIEKYVDMVKNDALSKNFIIGLKNLLKTKEAVQYFLKIGKFRWDLKFSSKYKFFWNKTKQNEYDTKLFRLIDSYFDDTVNAKMKELGY